MSKSPSNVALDVHKSSLPRLNSFFDEQASDDRRAAASSSRPASQPRVANANGRASAASARIDFDGADSARHRRSTSLSLNRSAPPPADLQPPGLMVPSPQEAAAPQLTGLRGFYSRNKGLCYVLLAQVFGCLMNVTTRLLEIEGNHGKGMHPFQILFVRMTITTTLSTAYMWWTSTPGFPFGAKEVRWLLGLRGMGGFLGVFGMYYSLLYLPLADATVITFIAPSISCFACALILKEAYTRIEQIGALISFLGVTLIARPTTLFQHGSKDSNAADGTTDAAAGHGAGGVDEHGVTSAERFSAVSVALVGVLGSALAFTAMRWIGKRAHPLLSVNYFCAFCTVVSAVAMTVLPDVPFLLPADRKEWSYLIFLGCCGFAMQFLLSAGLQHEKSSRATNMVYTQMLFALIFDKMVFGTNPSWLSLLGSSLILGSAIYVAIQKEGIKQRQEAEKARQEAAARGGQDVEMQPRRKSTELKEEERGLVSGMDAGDADEPADGSLANGHSAQNGYAGKSAS